MGLMENLLRVYHDVEGKLILANTLVLRSKKPVTGVVVRKAMELLMKRHPCCACAPKRSKMEIKMPTLCSATCVGNTLLDTRNLWIYDEQNIWRQCLYQET